MAIWSNSDTFFKLTAKLNAVHCGIQYIVKRAILHTYIGKCIMLGIFQLGDC